MPAVVREADDWERLDLALAENMAREDLNPIDEARACAMLVDDLGLTKGEVGRRVGRSRVAISNLIRLLELPEDVLDLIEGGQLSEGHGRALLCARTTTAAAGWPRRPATPAGPSARPSGGRARRRREPARRASVVVHPDLREALAAAEDALSAALGQDVKARAKGDGCVVEIAFDSPAEAVAMAERLLRRTPARWPDQARGRR